MKILDLTYTMEKDMPVYPGTEGPIIMPACDLESHGFREAYLQFYSHTGTHMDGPAHMIKDGKYLDDYPVDHFVGKALVIEVKGNKIERDTLSPYEDALRAVDYLILKTGWCHQWKQASYFKDYPTLTEGAASYLCGLKLKGIGLDAISVDPVSSKQFVIHNILLGASMVIIENLNLKQVFSNDIFLLTALPLKTKKTDGSPVRATAIYSI